MSEYLVKNCQIIWRKLSEYLEKNCQNIWRKIVRLFVENCQIIWRTIARIFGENILDYLEKYGIEEQCAAVFIKIKHKDNEWDCCFFKRKNPEIKDIFKWCILTLAPDKRDISTQYFYYISMKTYVVGSH